MTINSRQDSCLLHLRVSPNAARNEITGLIDDVLQVKVAAPPVKGLANRELIAYLSKLLGLNKSSLNIVKGQTSRNKVISLDGISYKEVLSRLLPKPSSSASDARSKR